MTLVRGPLHTLASAVRARTLRAHDLVSTSIAQIERHDPLLNATTERGCDDALARARAIDEGHVAPGVLLGAPTLIKDLEDWAGHPTKKGSLALAHVAPATTNGVVPSRLLDAGCVIVAKSTLPEFAIEGFTANLATGITHNPWNLDLSPGGSSGGSAAALAAGLVLVATATDGGGSVRIPASLCGLVGLKPTNGLIGRWPAPDWIDYSTDGPFATSTDDLRLLLDVMVGPIAGDPTAPPHALYQHLRRHEGRPLRLFAADRTSPLGPLPHEVRRAFHEAVALFSALVDRPVEWLESNQIFHGGDPDLDWFTITTTEHVSALGREWVTAHMDDFHVATQEYLGAGLLVNVSDYLDARRRRYHYVRQLDELLGDDGILLTPSVASTGWYADGRIAPNAPVHGLAPEVYSTAVQNVTGNPALSVPVGQLESGLPFGLQLTAPHFDDARLLDLAALVQEAYPWPRYAPGYQGLDELLGLRD